MHPEHPVQPIAYTHTVHLAKGLQCTFCHVGVDQGPEARIPGVTVCMTCHQVIATDRPEIKKIAAYQARGEDIPWVRVYNYSESAHVRFNHAPHIRAARGLRHLPRRYDQADHGRTQSEYEHGLLYQVPQAKAGLDRLRDLSLLKNRSAGELFMERRNFIKISALSGVMATLDACAQSGEAAHPFRSGRRADSRHRHLEAERLHAMLRGLRPAGARHARRRRSGAQRPARPDQDGPGEKARRQPPAIPSISESCARAAKRGFRCSTIPTASRTRSSAPARAAPANSRK